MLAIRLVFLDLSARQTVPVHKIAAEQVLLGISCNALAGRVYAFITDREYVALNRGKGLNFSNYTLLAFDKAGQFIQRYAVPLSNVGFFSADDVLQVDGDMLVLFSNSTGTYRVYDLVQ